MDLNIYILQSGRGEGLICKTMQELVQGGGVIAGFYDNNIVLILLFNYWYMHDILETEA